MELTVEAADIMAARQEGSVTVMTGRNPEGQKVVFGGDTRPMSVLAAGCLEDGYAVVFAEPWQILEVVDEGPSGPDYLSEGLAAEAGQEV
jgi:hypothetical protein